MTDIREYLARKPLLFDGGMGTYYKTAPGADCEMANLTDPEGVKKVHAEYLAAGAQAIKTNTFGLPRMAAAQMPGWEELAEAGWKLACDAAAEKDAAVFADLGPAPDTEAAPASSAYGLVAQQFLCHGVLCGAAGRLHPRGPAVPRPAAPDGAERRGGRRGPELRLGPRRDEETGAGPW